ncbi:SUMF1/EgtB/PvdO family nonheme iron enzyme [Gaoshiqia sediminis]|uniref:SUMF1/EgtB/PvdO family nonheme iron enzyme n=1 Tax=Gaoshiqia sediminis TaxID=2986998 RepID=A0AA41Y3I1_9BACT|nr:SUMF1/EgtB/PvdO family nonheme iron enzyme [Gaoshiqia sediminis]MCW0481179.1 SUMF1/EgtB/PvdO family nonheme iron enzyme [Gaoshiqia sediminis]
MKFKAILFLGLSVLLASCGLFKKDGGGFGKNKNVSSTTGWSYNDPDNGGFQTDLDYQQFAGPGLRFIQGGTFTMGRVEQDVMYDWNNMPRRVTVASFYMDETEVSNLDYREYLYWIQRVYPENMQKYEAALPDTLVWREELGYNEPYLMNYFRHPAYSKYPVVGVSWEQAEAYCKWRTDRVNEQILIDRGILDHDLSQSGQNVFTSESYLAGLYEGVAGNKPMEDAAGNSRRVKWEDGILMPNYRLPTEAEWEYAAYGLIGNTEGELLTERKIYPWNGSYLRDDSRKDRGQLNANFIRGRGDLMGMAGALNDNADITAPVDSYNPNDYGLYCMAGNVNEWVADVYRPLSMQDMNEFQPFRGTVYTRYKRDADGNLIRNEFGELQVDTIADYRNFNDGDYQSQIIEGQDWNTEKNNIATDDMYVKSDQDGQLSSLISDNVRVYKGGSWKDRPYWLIPGTRRYKEQTESTNDLGFRCAMTRVGSPQGF